MALDGSTECLGARDREGSSLSVTFAAGRKSGLAPTLEVLGTDGAPLDLDGCLEGETAKVKLSRLPLPGRRPTRILELR